MLVVKRLYSSDRKSALLSKAFNQVLQSIDVPLRFERLEFEIGYSRSEITDSKATFGVLLAVPEDERFAKVLLKFELYRLFVKGVVMHRIPGAVEDVVVARQMIDRGHAEDLVYLFYVFMLGHRVKDKTSFLRHNLPWIAFANQDDFYRSFFYELAQQKRRRAYEHGAKGLFAALCRDLMDFENLKSAISAYDKFFHGDAAE